MSRKLSAVLLLLFGAGTIQPANAQHPEWALTFGGISQDWVRDIAVDADGNMYSVGTYFERLTDADTAVFDFTSTANWGKATVDIFITKTDAAGNLIWGKTIGSDQQDHAYGIAVDEDANLYITGHFQGVMDFDPDPNQTYTLMPLNASPSMFLMKMDSAGNLDWAKQMGVTTSSSFGKASGRAIAIGPDGNLVVAGEYTGVIDFDPNQGETLLNARQHAEIFVAKYNRSGALIWVDSFEAQTAVPAIAYAVGVDADNYIYVTGSFEGTVDFDPGPGLHELSSVGGLKDAFVCKLSPSGDFRWAFSLGAGEDDWASGLVVDDSAHIYVTGRFWHTVNFNPAVPGSENRKSEGGSDMFLSKYDSTGSFMWVRTAGGTGSDIGKSLTIDIAGQVYVGGAYSGTAQFDAGSSLTTPGNDFFIAKYDRNGNHLWAAGNSTGRSSIEAIRWCVTGDLYAGAIYNGAGTLQIGAFTADLPAYGSDNNNLDILLLKLACDQASVPLTLDITTCDSFRYGSVTYDVSGVYPHIYRNAFGCDSVVTLHLVLRDLEPEISPVGAILNVVQEFSAYQWLLNGAVIPGATGREFTPEVNGNYQVIAFDTDGCTDTSRNYEINNLSIGTAGYQEQFTLYPNPADDRIYISGKGASSAVLTNLSGQILYRTALPAELNLQPFAPGIYLLQVYNPESRIIRAEKIIKR